MAKASRKRMSKEELNAPDEIEVALSKFWDKLVKLKTPILGGVAALIAIAVVLWIVGATSRSSAEGRADAMRTAVAPLRGSVGEADPSLATLPGPKPPQFATAEAQVAEAQKTLAAYSSEYGSDDSMQLVALTDANLKLDAGDATGAAAAVEQWIAKYPESAAMVVALELKARALTAKGDTGAAIAAWQALAGAATGELKADALRHVGDLQNPVFTDGGDAAKAKAAYDEALVALGAKPEEEDVFSLGPQGLEGDLKNRLDLLPQ